jgi:hypothetical protein
VRLVTYELDGAVGRGVVGALGDVPVLGATIRGILERGGEHWRAVVQYASEHADDAGTSTRRMRWSSSPGDGVQRPPRAGPADLEEPVDDGQGN